MLLIICLIGALAIGFFVSFCYQTSDENFEKIPISYREIESIKEIPDHLKQDYINNVIIKVCKFYDLREEIKEKEEDAKRSSFPGIILWLTLSMLTALQVYKILSITWFLCAIIGIVACTLLFWSGSIIYKKSEYTMQGNNYTKEYLNYLFVHTKEALQGYLLDEETMWSIHLALHYENYIEQIKDTVYFRHACRKFLYFIEVIMFFLFFLPSGY